jgi:nucleoside-diphosphate-sugar epimerase
MSRILVTGGAEFMGANLVASLVREGRETSVEELASLVGSAIGVALAIEGRPPRKADAIRNFPTTDRAQQALGKAASVELPEGLWGTADRLSNARNAEIRPPLAAK